MALHADNPWEVGFNLIAGLDNAFILGYSFLIMSFLGWAAGSVLFIVGMCICFYCNCVTGTLHTLGGQRNIHFRDLARVGFGKPSTSIILQHVSLSESACSVVRYQGSPTLSLVCIAASGFPGPVHAASAGFCYMGCKLLQGGWNALSVTVMMGL